MGRVIPHWSDWKAIVPLTVIPVLIALAGGALFLPAMQRFRSSEANAAMLASPAPIDGQRAYGYLKKICEIGPRIAGSPENTRQRKMVADHFTKMGGQVREQPFAAEHPLTGRQVDMVNLIGSWHPERLQRVVISAHYDTRPHADQEDDPDRVKLPFLGANDCASGVALLMEIAHHLDKIETPWGVDLVLFDGEELVYGDRPRKGEYFLGSWAFARAYAKQVERRGNKSRYVAGILLDMVGGKGLQIKREPNSMDFAPELVREVWAVARQVNAKSFVNDVGRGVLDDHLPLNDAGIRTIDLIDFDYPFWHKADDLPENCSAESLAEVGRVLTAWLAQPPRRARR
jgi:glutaminyl-peptide cyclotransferase